MLASLFKKKSEQQVPNSYEIIHNSLTNSFNSVKEDTSRIFQWLDFFQKKMMQQDTTIQNLQYQIQQSQSQSQEDSHSHSQMRPIEINREQIRDIVDEYYEKQELSEKMHRLETFNKHMINQLKYVDSRIDSILNSQIQPKLEVQSQSQSHSQIQKIPDEIINQINERISKLESGSTIIKRTNFKEKLVQKITKNSKDYIKNFIFSLIQKYEDVSAQKLREIVVEEQGLCSKSSFYRLLAELENDERINVLHQGKEKKYLFKLLQQTHQKV